MRQKLIGQNLSGRDFIGQKIEGYFRNCDFSNCNFTGSTIIAVAVNCKFDGSDFSNASIGKFYTPNSTFVNCKFKKPFWHTLAHEALGTFSVIHSHEVIYEIARQWIAANLKGATRTKALNFMSQVRDRKDLSWAEFSKMLDRDNLVRAFQIFKDYPPLYRKLLQFRPELEPEELKDARLNS